MSEQARSEQALSEQGGHPNPRDENRSTPLEQLLRCQVSQLSAALEQSERRRADSSAASGMATQLDACRRELDEARAALRAIRTSTSLQLGQALTGAARDPLRQAPALPRTLRDLWRSGRRHEAQRGVAGGSTAATAGVSGAATAGVPSVPHPGRPAPGERRFALRLPVPPEGSGGADSLMVTLPKEFYVPKRLAQYGLEGYEPEALAMFLAVLDHTGKGAVLDIGANIALYAALASWHTDRPVHAIEPVPRLVDAARRILADNGLPHSVHQLALGAENGVATLFLSDSTDSSNSLLEGFRPSSEQIDVAVETLDNFVERLAISPSVLKIDTEATEPNVVRGGARTITEHRPWIFCEVLKDRVEADLMEVLRPHGYTWYHLGAENESTPRTRIVGDGSYAHLMWLFAPSPVESGLWDRAREWQQALEKCHP